MIKMMIIVVFFFAFCWLPFNLLQVCHFSYIYSRYQRYIATEITEYRFNNYVLVIDRSDHWRPVPSDMELEQNQLCRFRLPLVGNVTFGIQSNHLLLFQFKIQTGRLCSLFYFSDTPRLRFLSRSLTPIF